MSLFGCILLKLSDDAEKKNIYIYMKTWMIHNIQWTKTNNNCEHIQTGTTKIIEIILYFFTLGNTIVTIDCDLQWYS